MVFCFILGEAKKRVGERMAKIIGGSSSQNLARELSQTLGIECVPVTLERFADQELRVELLSDMHDEDIVLVQSTCNPANDHLMELLLLIDAARHAGGRRIIGVIPYFGYSRQDRPFYERGPISARLVATLLEAAGLDDIVTVDLHSQHVEEFFTIGVHTIDLSSFFAQSEELGPHMTIISPDIGGIPRAQKLADHIGADLAIITKGRHQPNACHTTGIRGQVQGKHCIIIDDIIDTGGTLASAASLLKAAGASHIKAIATHPVLSGSAIDVLEKSGIEHIVTTNTISRTLHPPLFRVLTIVPELKKALERLLAPS